MLFRIITPADAGAIRAEARILFESTVERAHVTFAHHAGADITLIAPLRSRDVFLIADGNSPEHGCDMHAGVRSLEAIVHGASSPDAIAADAWSDEHTEIVEG